MAAGEIAPQLLTFASGTIDKGVDSFEAQGTQAPFMPGPEPTGDLLRGPALGEAVLDEGP